MILDRMTSVGAPVALVCDGSGPVAGWPEAINTDWVMLLAGSAESGVEARCLIPVTRIQRLTETPGPLPSVPFPPRALTPAPLLDLASARATARFWFEDEAPLTGSLAEFREGFLVVEAAGRHHVPVERLARVDLDWRQG